jgi:hypothetical protein
LSPTHTLHKLWNQGTAPEFVQRHAKGDTLQGGPAEGAPEGAADERRGALRAAQGGLRRGVRETYEAEMEVHKAGQKERKLKKKKECRAVSSAAAAATSSSGAAAASSSTAATAAASSALAAADGPPSERLRSHPRTPHRLAPVSTALQPAASTTLQFPFSRSFLSVAGSSMPTARQLVAAVVPGYSGSAKEHPSFTASDRAGPSSTAGGATWCGGHRPRGSCGGDTSHRSRSAGWPPPPPVTRTCAARAPGTHQGCGPRRRARWRAASARARRRR